MVMASLIGASLLHLYPMSPSPSSHHSLHQLAPVLPLFCSSHASRSFVLSTSSCTSKRFKCMHNKKITCLNKDEVHPCHEKRSSPSVAKYSAFLAVPLVSACLFSSAAISLTMDGVSSSSFHMLQALSLADLDPLLAGLMIRILGPFFASLNFLFIIRIVMSWYPQLPVEKFPYVIVFAPTEPVLEPTRRLIPPVGGVDVSPVIWVALMSFINEILLGQQGLLVLLSQQQT